MSNELYFVQAPDNPWQNWVIEKNRSGELTITDHKKIHKNARPEYAQTFAERKIHKSDVQNDPNRTDFRIPDESSLRDKNLHWIEREHLDGSVVERLLDYSGAPRKVTLIVLEGGIPTKLIVHDWISRGKWKLTSTTELIDNKWQKANIPGLLVKSLPWSEEFSA